MPDLICWGVRLIPPPTFLPPPMRRTYLLLTFVLSAASSSGYADDVDFNNDVRPILSNKCLLCHGPDPDSLESGLRLDMPDIAMSTLESGNIAVVPGKPALSDLIVRITSDDEIETLQKWIEQGAQFSRHWAYVKPVHREPPPPPTEYANWPKNAVDNFTLRRMLDHELPPSPEADRYAIARRVFLDLTGLPP
ncbi:MAG: hypothetical protein GY826_19600, partial [Fuerstiella sp.]|nr:hypothetical protein [Fuerstiella sp.]